MAAKLNRDVKRGDTFLATFKFRNKKTKAPVDLTGATISGGVTKGSTYIPYVVTILSAGGGDFQISLPTSTTSTMDLGKWSHSLKVTYPSNVVKTLFEGQFVVVA